MNVLLDNYHEFFESPVEKSNVSTAWLAFPVLIKKTAPFKRKEFQIYLEKENIQTRVVFTGNILRQPMMFNQDYKKSEKGFANADAIMERGVLLPLHHAMTDKMFKRLHLTIDRFLRNYN